MKTLILIFFLGLIGLLSSSGCSSTVSDDQFGDTTSVEIKATTEDSLLFGPPIVGSDILVVDTTILPLPFIINNENYIDLFDSRKRYELTINQFNELGLNRLDDCSIDNGCEFYVLGEIQFSEAYETRLIFRDVQSEWKLWLVNYNQDNFYLDDLMILYGDNVEGYFETFSTVQEAEIEVTEVHYDYSSEEIKSEETISIYKINQEGMFQLTFVGS